MYIKLYFYLSNSENRTDTIVVILNQSFLVGRWNFEALIAVATNQ